MATKVAAEDAAKNVVPSISAVAPTDWTTASENPKLEGCGAKGTDCEECCTGSYGFSQMPWRIYCKKGCNLEGGWKDCQSSCKDMCFKDPTIRDYKWSSWFDRSPGDPVKSKACTEACLKGCLWRMFFQKEDN
eukprot:TRINITY_DN18532_c0_g1_i1.p1 TRINITY_DN18532_c0_g1~~TRINITY_DN18532_c0_g1_i1.p1  ORF type:complete len:133 (-),score=3.38 TRINITY_DN18532_c0_g1_i1:323-721(-)